MVDGDEFILIPNQIWQWKFPSILGPKKWRLIMIQNALIKLVV